MLRWGILSTAKIAREQLIPAILAAQGSSLVAIASRDEALLESPEVDAVYIPLPTSQHLEWAGKAVAAGKHVLVEKPLALRAEDIVPLIAARDRARVVVAEAFMVRHHPQWDLVRDWIAAGRIGRLRQVQGAFSYFNDDPANMRNILALGGGALPDIGVYPVVTTRLATGQEPRTAFATVERHAAFGTDILAEAIVRFEDFTLSFYVATQMGYRQTMVFHGTEGFIEVETPFNVGPYGDALVRLHDRTHSAAESRRFGALNQYREQVEAFARRVRGEDAPHFSLEDSVLNQRVIDALFRSERSGSFEAV